MKERGRTGRFAAFLPTFLRIISERVEPGEYACVPLPRRLSFARRRDVDLFKRLPLRFQIGPGVMVGGVEADMAKPTADDSDMDARRDEMHGGGMAEAVRRHMFGSKGWSCFGRRIHIGGEFEPDA